MANMIYDKTTFGKINDENTTVITYSKDFPFHRVEIGGKNNQCLQFSLNAFYKEIHELKQAIILWNLINWSKTKIIRCNNNAFVINIMIGYNTLFYDLDTKHWYWD